MSLPLYNSHVGIPKDTIAPLYSTYPEMHFISTSCYVPTPRNICIHTYRECTYVPKGVPFTLHIIIKDTTRIIIYINL